MGHDKGHRGRRLAHGGEHPGHEPAQAVGPGEVGQPCGGQPLDHPGGDPRHRAAADAPGPGAGDDQEHHEHPPQGHAGEAHLGESQHQDGHRYGEGGHVTPLQRRLEQGAAGLLTAGPLRAQEQPCRAGEEIGAPRPQKGLRQVQGRCVGHGAVEEHHGHAREEQGQKRHRRGVEGVGIHPPQLGEGPPDGRHRDEGRRVADGHVHRGGEQIPQKRPQHRGPQAAPGGSRRHRHPKGGVPAKHQPPGAQQPGEEAGPCHQGFAGIGRVQGFPRLLQKSTNSGTFHQKHRLLSNYGKPIGRLVPSL